MSSKQQFRSVLVMASLVALLSAGCSDEPTENVVQSDPETGITAGLVAHWTFDEGAGAEAGDASSFANKANVVGASWTEGVVGGALEFDGQDDYVVILDDSMALGPQLAQLSVGAISIWFRVDFIPTRLGMAPLFYYGSAEYCPNAIDASNHGVVIEIGHSPVNAGSERLYFTIFANDCTGPTFCFDTRYAVTKGEWHHFVAVVGEDYNNGYFDGQEMTWRNFSFGNAGFSLFLADAVSHEMLAFGRGSWRGEEYYFDGAIDDIRIYDRPLNISQVTELYELGRPEAASEGEVQ